MKFKRILMSLLAATLLYTGCVTSLTVFGEGVTVSDGDEQVQQDTAPDNNDSDENEDDHEIVIQDDVDESRSMISLPNNLRGTIITPGVDFILSEEDSAEDVAKQLEKIIANADEIGLNTLIINTSHEGKLYYNTDMNKTSEVDFIKLAIDYAHENLFNAFLVFDINPSLSVMEGELEGVNKLVSQIHRFTVKYYADGIILDDYYAKVNAEAYANYMLNGSGIGYSNWLYDSTEYLFQTAGEIVRMTDNTIPVGIMISDVWANSTTMENGSPTADKTQALVDGHSDTRKYIKNGYCDFLLLRSYGSLTDETLPFAETANWWGELCKSIGIPMYLIHYNEKMGTDNGWGSVDQLLKQLVQAKETPAYEGSVFNSYKALLEDPMSSTTTLKKFYAEQINEESLNEELTMHSPKDLKFTTYEPVVDFSGTFDENFDVYFNGVRIKLNEAGNFYFEEPLSIGKNTFTLRHKSKTYTYNIERKIITMKELDSSISDGKTLRVDGGTSVTISALAYKGSSVVATVNGQAITLKETSSSNDENINSSYTNFVATYKVPAGIIEVEQPLGKISVKASYQGYSRELSGANIIVNALPRPVQNNQQSHMFDQETLGSGEVVGTISPYKTADERVDYVRVLKNNTAVYDAKTTGETLNPNFGQLPAGTLDYLKSTQGNYYTTESGKRFAASDVSVFSDTGIGENALVVKSTGTYQGDSYFKIAMDYKTGYNVELAGLTFGEGYSLSSFNPSYVYITFDNVTSVTKLPSFGSNQVFDAGTWEVVNVDGVPKFRMVLRLAQTGVYAGNSAYYDENGDLMLTFQVLTNNITNMNVVIDPGHGYGKSADKFDPGAIGHVIEQEVNLAISKQLTSQLQSLGVNAVRLKTESSFLLTSDRPVFARNYNCDLFLSIHANRVQGNETARGTEVYYYTPFSQPLASAISKSVSSYFTSNVYEDGADKNRGAKYSYYWVTMQHDFPSVLIETGFVSNMEDAMALANTKHQSGISKAIIKGINSYLSRSSISYSSNGNASIPDVDYDTPTSTQPPDPVYEEESEESSEEFDDYGDFDDAEYDEIEPDSESDISVSDE